MTDAATAYRRGLINGLLASHADAAAAYEVLREVFVANHPDPGQRWHVEMNEVRHLYTYLMVPKGPGRLISIWDLCAHPLGRLKEWTVEQPCVSGFNLERDRLPYEDGSIDGMLLCETIEHFNSDPMFALIEANRVLKPDGFLLVSVPNAASWFGIMRALDHKNPSRYAVYGTTEQTRFHSIHAREYVVPEVAALIEAAGFQAGRVTTMDYGALPPFDPIPGFDPSNRGETIFCMGRKIGAPMKRYLTPIYAEDVPFTGFR